ncbi:MAG: hypothetical protein JWR19_4104 [Pedosphaera sp.]|nr:hypothetical protein [Pedosphaera sp.]
MDVHCSTCNEPWDAHHLWHDAVFETGLTVEGAQTWCSLPRNQKLSDRYREEFRAVGWEFGQTLINVVHCPSCPKDAQPNPERVQTKAALEDLLGDDQDGLAAAFEDYRL